TSERAIIGRFVKVAAGSLLGVVAERFVREKREQAILQNRPSRAAAPVVEAIAVPDVAIVVAVVFGKGVQTRAMRLEVEAAVVRVGPVLRNNLDLRAAVPSIFRVVVVRDDFHFLDGVLVRSNNRSAAPRYAGSAYPVELVVVFSGAGAVRRD